MISREFTTLKKPRQQCNFELRPIDNRRLANLCGQYDEHLRQVERCFGVEISNRGHSFRISGHPDSVSTASQVINHLYADTQHTDTITANKIHVLLQTAKTNNIEKTVIETQQDIQILTQSGLIKPRGNNQQRYLKSIFHYDLNFGIGPAGTGKTYLAVACAVELLARERIRRILLVRPVVEAGERLGFLPGDLAQKVDPYFRPLYDALYEMMGAERVTKLIERHIIEIVPLAYMRGRTLNDAFIILDESQNTTREQMKMFLTRIGFNSIAVITGDITQIDLPKGIISGLCHSLEVLKNVQEISVTYFDNKDVVRHPLVQSIVEAYDKHEKNNKTK